MRKNILKFGSLALFAAVLFTSCEEDTVTYNGSDFVTFNQASSVNLAVSETAGTLNIPVNLTMPQSSDLTIDYTLTSEDAVAGTHYNVLTPTLTIPAGETTANLQLEIIDDDTFNLARTLTLTLTGTSISTVGVGIGDEGSYSKVIVINNNDFDCETEFFFWLGEISVEDVGYGSTPGTASGGADCDVLFVDNNLPASGAPENTMYELLFSPSNPEGTIGTVEVLPTFVQVQPSGGVNYDGTYVAEGTYNTETGEIVLEYRYAAFQNGQDIGTFYSGTNIITIAD